MPCNEPVNREPAAEFCIGGSDIVRSPRPSIRLTLHFMQRMSVLAVTALEATKPLGARNPSSNARMDGELTVPPSDMACVKSLENMRRRPFDACLICPV